MSITLGALWNGTKVSPIILEEYSTNNYTWWRVKINSVKYWVIRRIVKDLRPIIVDELKPYFGIPKCGTHYYRKGNQYVMLIRSFDPHTNKEVMLNQYISCKDLITDAILEQVQRIYVFRMMTSMSRNINKSLVVRKCNGRITIYSLYDSFPADGTPKNEIPNSVLTRWFEIEGVEFYVVLAQMLGTPSNEDDDPDDLFGAAIDRLSVHLEELIHSIDPNLAWFQSDIINYVIGKATPR